MTDFTNIDYLKIGNHKQVLAFEILTKKNILFKVAEYHPILVGTIPINIDIENSDLDIICYWENKADFIEKLKTEFSHEYRFTIRETQINHKQTVIAGFKSENFEIEIFGQNIPTKEQDGYRHMIKEHQILQSKDENFRLEIIKLKKNGYKTEPAFGFLLGLKGDPYTQLLDYKI